MQVLPFFNGHSYTAFSPYYFLKLHQSISLMKQLFIPFVILIAALTSCTKKEYSCHCAGGIGGPFDVVLEAQNKKAANSECKTFVDHTPGGTADGPTDCYLK